MLRAALVLLLSIPSAAFAEARIVKTDAQIDAADPGIKLFVRSKIPEGMTSFTDDNIVLFVHGATFPSTPDFDLEFRDYSWADYLVRRGYAVYLFDKRNYGFSTREKAMDEPPAANKPVSRSYQVIRDIESVVEHVRNKHGVKRVTLIGWSWGAMTAGYFASLHGERVSKLVLYAPLYNFPQHPNLGAGSGNQDKRHPAEFDYSKGAYRLGSAQGDVESSARLAKLGPTGPAN